jgi:hypothetical protein
VPAPDTSARWLDILDDVGADIRAFEREHGPLNRIVPPAFAALEDGRLYDMVFGPKATL